MKNYLFKFFCVFGIFLISLQNGIAVEIHEDESEGIADPKQKKVQITGEVTDVSGEPLIGATVYEKESANGSVTDVNGKFSIMVPPGCHLVVSYVGFKEKTVDLREGETSLKIVLDESETLVNEIVVIGYGSQKKVNLSGAVGQVTADDLERRPISDISKGLQGVVPNLNIDFSSGEPGQGAHVNIRGVPSINGGSPLLLIDGVAADIKELNYLMPQDIESISVLKDAASAAIYGARAAFGVILITTKTSKENRIKINYNNGITWKKPTIFTKRTADPYIYLKLKNIGALNTPWSSGHVTSDERLEWARRRSDDPSSSPAVRLNPLDETQWDYMGDTNWMDKYLNNGTASAMHQLSLSGSTNRTRFLLAAGYNYDQGVLAKTVDHDDYRRYNTHLKVDYKVWNWLRIGNNTSFVLADRNKPSHYNENISQIYDAQPSDMDKNPDGTWASDGLGKYLAEIVDGGRDRTQNTLLRTSFSGEASFWEEMVRINVNFTFSTGNDINKWYYSKYKIGYGPDDIREKGSSQANVNNENSLYKVFDVYGTFNKRFSKHQVTAILGFNQEYYKRDKVSSTRHNLMSDMYPSIALASGEQHVTELIRDWAVRGLFYRANYIYDDKYIFEINGRYDGSSRFPSDKRFGFFPSGSIAWRVESEPFFQNLLQTVSQLKLRASYGSLGNQLVSEYGYIPTMEASTGKYIIDGALQQIVSSPELVSQNYTWEEVNTLNFGVDLGLFNNRFSSSFDIYRRDTRGMLALGKELPGVIGAKEPMENAADLRTIGWELSIGYNDQLKLFGKPLSLGARFVLSDNSTEITKFDNPDKNLSQYYEGQRLGEIWGLQNDGMFQSEEEIANLDETQIIPWGALSIVKGWPKYKDLDHDGKITKGATVDKPGDLSIIGNSSPRFRYGLNFNMEWNGIDFTAFLQGVGKRDYYPERYLYWSFFQQPYSGGQIHAFDFYRPKDDSPAEMEKHSQAYINAGLASKNTDSKYPVMQCWLADANLGVGIHGMGLAIPQTKYLLNASYVRLKNVTLGYTLPNSWTEKIHISKCRIYLSGDNLLALSELCKYFDPEAVTDENHFGYVHPFNRQYTIGLNITF